MTSSIYRAHPWHGISVGENAPDLIYAFIEILPTDVIKYEVHKPSGHIFVDRPLLYSSQCPTLYGFIPQTYAAEDVASLAQKVVGPTALKGDGDPIDICVLTERPITRGAILMRVRPIGGIRLIDRGEADDKIIAVLHNDAIFGEYKDISECPDKLIDRLQHYFLTYKDLPTSKSEDQAKKKDIFIAEVYGSSEAKKVINAGIQDYKRHFAAELAKFESL
jgi:inorganic pyrophosphatase